MKRLINQYIVELLKFPNYLLTDEEERAIEKSGLVPYLTKKILSNKFRKSAPSSEVLSEIHNRLKKSVNTNSPIHLTIPTGGYKKWQFAGAPRVDWAEVFHLRFMLEYMAPIAAAYEPGVVLDYFSNGWLIKTISFYPQEDLDAYTQSFRKLIGLFSHTLPTNIQIRYNVVADQLPEKVLLERAIRNRPAVEEEWQTLSKESRSEMLAYSERNIRWDIVEKTRKLSQLEKEHLIYEGKIIHDCLLSGGWNNDLYYLRSENGIGIIHRNSDPYFLHLATVAGSFVQFWVGSGVLEKRGDKLLPRVLSYNQYQKLKSNLETKRVFAVQGENYQTIDIHNSV